LIRITLTARRYYCHSLNQLPRLSRGRVVRADKVQGRSVEGGRAPFLRVLHDFDTSNGSALELAEFEGPVGSGRNDMAQVTVDTDVETLLDVNDDVVAVDHDGVLGGLGRRVTDGDFEASPLLLGSVDRVASLIVEPEKVGSRLGTNIVPRQRTVSTQHLTKGQLRNTDQFPLT
jgi:hypothetical protein